MNVEPVYLSAGAALLSPLLLKLLGYALKKAGVRDKELERYRQGIEAQLDECRKQREIDRRRIGELEQKVARLETRLEYYQNRRG